MQKIISIFIATFIFTMLGLGVASSASASVPDANLQGGSTGVLFMTEESDGTIYVGDFTNTPSAKSVYWHQADSWVDSIAVTSSRVAWSSLNATLPTSNDPVHSDLRGKVLISDVGAIAGAITTVTIPDDPAVAGLPSVTSLAADYFGERFYVTTNEGKIYSFFSDGTDVTLVAAAASVATVNWGLWADGYNNTLVYCNTGGSLYKSTITGTAVSAPVLLKSAFLTGCDGLGVDPVDGKIFGATYANNPPVSFNTFAPATNTQATVNFTASSVTGLAPSSMFVSHITSKIYFTTELNVYEVNYDGTGARVLYSGSHTTRGFENIAVYYGATLGNITTTGAAAQVGAAATIAAQTAANAQAAQNNGQQNNTPTTTSAPTTSAATEALAQTGQNAWYLPVFSLIGVFLTTLGINLVALGRVRAKR